LKTESFLKDLNIPKLSEEEKLSCEGRITLEECTLTLQSFQNNKTPGNDGIPIEFYTKVLVTTLRAFHPMHE